MNFLNKNKGLLIAIAVIALGVWVYSSFFKPSPVETSSDLTAQKIGGDVLSLYASLQSVKFDKTLFSSPLYRNLEDFSKPIPDQAVGRNNPFDVIGR